MGEVVNLSNVELCTDPGSLADWLASMAEAIRANAVGVSSLLLVVESKQGRLGTYAQADTVLDTARVVGLLTLAAQYKANGCEDDPLGIR